MPDAIQSKFEKNGEVFFCVHFWFIVRVAPATSHVKIIADDGRSNTGPRKILSFQYRTI